MGVYSAEFLDQQRQVLEEKLTRYRLWGRRTHPPVHIGVKERIGIPFIEEALRRIADGSYGFCDDCGEPIGHWRLRSIPGALRCRICQEAYR